MLDGLLQRLISRSFRRGLGGEPIWLAVGVAAWMVVRSRRKDRPVVWSGRLEEGQELILRVRGSQVEAEPTSRPTD
jgi:hypothetical protein